MIRRIPRWIIWGSVMLAFSAGYVNAVALLGFVNNAVSHVTGTATMAAVAIADLDASRLLPTALIIAAFLAGAVLSGFIVKSEALRMGRHYGVALGVEAGLLLLATLLFHWRSFYGELAASAACGLQNAMVATYSGSVIRTTHLTGIISDIGAALGNALAGRPMNKPQLRLQTAIFCGFVGGASTGAFAFDALDYYCLLVPSGIVLCAALLYIRLSAGQTA